VLVLVIGNTVGLILLGVLLAGLLRSHADVLTRLSRERRSSDSGFAMAPGVAPVAGSRSLASTPSLTGKRLDGRPISVDLGPGAASVLLAFLSSGCSSCDHFWEAFRTDEDRSVGGAKVVIVTKDTSLESPSQLLKKAPPGFPLVMSTAAWTDFAVPTSPYFIFVDGDSGEIRGEGAASEWRQLRSLVEDAVADARLSENGKAGSETLDRGLFDSHPERIRQMDRALLGAGITPDHPSLWPEQRPSLGGYDDRAEGTGTR
jgi:hypothetical protein